MPHTNEEAVAPNPAPTAFTPEKPANTVKPEFEDEGKIFDAQPLGNAEVKDSKRVRIVGKSGLSNLKTPYVASDQSGTFVVEVLLDESEQSGGNPVWRALDLSGSPFSVSAGVLKSVTFEHIARQMRIKFTNGVTPATVSAWVFSAR